MRDHLHLNLPHEEILIKVIFQPNCELLYAVDKRLWKKKTNTGLAAVLTVTEFVSFRAYNA